jgi:hypothetical protein
MTVNELVPQWFRETAMGQRLLEKQAKKRATERRVMVKELVAVHQCQETELPPLRKAAEAARAKLEKAEAARKRAGEDCARAHQAVSTRSHTLDRDVARLEHELRATADPAIEAFVEEMRELLDATRREPNFSSEWSAPDWNGQQHPVSSNHANVHAYMDAIKGAATEAEALLLEADLDVPARLATIRAKVDAAREQAQVLERVG